MKKPFKRVKKTATVNSSANDGEQRTAAEAETKPDDPITIEIGPAPFQPEPPTRDYDGEYRRGKNVAAVRDRRDHARDMIGTIYSDAIHAEGAEKFAAESLGVLAEVALKLLGKVAERKSAVAAEYAAERLEDIAKQMKARLDRQAQARARAKKGGRSREGKDRFRKWVEKIVGIVVRQQKMKRKSIKGRVLPDTEFARRGALTHTGKDPKPGWITTLMQILKAFYDDPSSCPDGPNGKWKNRQRHAKQIIEIMWTESQSQVSESHKRWVKRDQTGDY